MIEIFVHRARFKSKENSVQGIKAWTKSGVGIELDLRLENNSVIMKHDITEAGELFDVACKIIQKFNIRVALHIKEIESLNSIIKIIKKYNINKKCFLFSDLYTFDKLFEGGGKDMEIAHYASECPIDIKAKILWCDELKNKWFNTTIISDLHKENKILYAMSKELSVPSSSMYEITKEWKRLIELGFDGICTDYARELSNFRKNKRLN